MMAMISAATAAVVVVRVVVANEDTLRAGGVRRQAIRGRGLSDFGTRPGYAMVAATAGSRNKDTSRRRVVNSRDGNSQSHAC